jgi:hypothetical protein
MKSPLAYRSIVKDIEGLEGAGWRWVHQDPELRFTAPDGAARFSMELSIPESNFKQTGPLQVSFWIDEEPCGTHVFPEPGDHKASIALPKPIPAGKVVKVRMHVHNPYIAGFDHARLGFVLVSAGLSPAGPAATPHTEPARRPSQ